MFNKQNVLPNWTYTQTHCWTFVLYIMFMRNYIYIGTWSTHAHEHAHAHTHKQKYTNARVWLFIYSS